MRFIEEAMLGEKVTLGEEGSTVALSSLTTDNRGMRIGLHRVPDFLCGGGFCYDGPESRLKRFG
jgi:hypothetical protein